MKNTSSSLPIRTRLLLFLGVLSSTGLLFAQEKRLDGTIQNGKDVEGIHVLNTSSRFNSITNSIGEFYITVKPNDTLLVSSIAYVPQQIVITDEIYVTGYLSVTLEDLVNELDEVYLGPQFTGDLERDIKKIKVEDQINFDDVGIPGFKGTPEEKIPRLVGQVITPVSVDVEGLYKYITGYYRKLKLKRKWHAQNLAVSHIIHTYSPRFFKEAYHIPEDHLYDFLLYCVESTDLIKMFETKNYVLVLAIFEKEGEVYVKRLQEKRE